MAKEIYSNSKRTRKQMNSNRPVRKKRRRKSLLKIICIIVVAFSAVAIAGMAVWNSSLFLNDTDGGEGLDDAIGTINEDVINVLVLGIDTDEDTDRDVNNLTDTIMVASFHLKDGSVTVLQIPRDTYIGDEYTSTGKINALYGSSSEYSGIDGLAQYIFDNFKIPIDHYATVTMKGFRTAIDKIGGVEIDVPETIHLDGVTIEAGHQTLDGNQSEKFVRYREKTQGDLGRLEMQRLFLASMISQFLGTSKWDLATMVPSLAGEISTDMSTKEMVSIGSEVMNLNTEDISFLMVPGESTYAGSQSVYSVHHDELAKIINAHFRYDMDPITADDLGVPELANTVDYYDDAGGTVDDITGIKGGLE